MVEYSHDATTTETGGTQDEATLFIILCQASLKKKAISISQFSIHSNNVVESLLAASLVEVKSNREPSAFPK